ncbi:hypothetical protein KZX50_03825 [Bacillus infantis]|uniref:hypothetical protein n=1 Tax=Bacillus infantis TaxID=324767 RepID=UPI000B9C50B9|nr:hypothetical protein [Bacillus infantis]MCK6204587.1 hypothetical protein [Bacillus infantis]OXT19268.1 hypothetical protein B9K06_02600 [Bacillus sp. OG2]
MVKKSEWNDEQLERLLRQLPKIQDERAPQEIYQNVSRRMRKRRRTFWVIPAAAAAAAVLLLFILIPGMTGQQFQESADQAAENKGDQASSGIEPSEQKENSYETAQKSEDTSEGEAGVQNDSEAEPSETEVQEDDGKAGLASFAEEESDYRTALYEEDVQGQTILTYAIPDANIQTLVPVSVLAPPEEGKTEFDLYKETMEKLTEEEWGLGEAYPIPETELYYDQETETLTADLTKEADLNGSAKEVLFNSILTNNIDSLHAKSVLLTTEGEPGVENPHTGVVESLPVADDKGNHAYYFLYTNPQSPPFIVPGEESYGSIQEAIEAMKLNKDTLGLEPSIPSDMNIKSETESEGEGEGSELTLTLEEGTKLEDNAVSSYTIEAILLMAKGFNYSTVKLDNAEIEEVGSFQLQEALNVPAAPNLRQLP